MKKRILSLLLALVMVLSLLPTAAFAVEEAAPAIPESASAVRENPLYSDESSASAVVSKEAKKSMEAWAAASADTKGGTDADGYYYDLDEIRSIIANYLVNRTAEFELSVRLDSCYVYTNELIDMVYLLFEEAMAHNGIPNQGDYLQWVYGWVSYGYYGAYTYNGCYYLTMTYEVDYYTTAAQEAEVTRKLNSLMPSFGFTEATDTYTKLYTIYKYLCDNIVYDYDHLNTDYMLQYTAYAGLINGTCVCQGYAVLFYRMALMAGVDARVVTGDGGGPHAWNIAQVGPYYYNLDSTWDAGYPPAYWEWFLLNESSFYNHYREYPYNTTEFYNAYPMGSTNYTNTSYYRTEGELEYYIHGGVASVNNYFGSGSSVTVPSYTQQGYPVVEVRHAFYGKSNLKTIIFEGAAPAFYSDAFTGVTATVYYPCYEGYWPSGKLQNYGGSLTWKKNHDFEDGYCWMCGVTMSAPVVKASNNATTGKVVLTWDAVEGAAKYEVWRATSKTGTYTKIWGSSATTCTHTGATAGKSYYYKVRAIASDGSVGPFSTIVNRVCDFARPVVKASNRASDGKIVLTWDAVDGATKYEVYRSTSKSGTYTKIWASSATTCVHTSAEAGKSYYYKVRALGANASATSAYSTVVNRVCDYARPVVKAANSAATGKVVLSWAAVEGATKYELYRATSKNGTYEKIWSANKTSVTHSGTPGKTYYYKVRALGSNSSATSAFSAIVQRTCDYARPVVKVTNNATTGKVVLSWAAVPGATKYELYRSTSLNGTYEKIWSDSKTSVTHSGTPGKTYYYKVRALGSNSNATSAFSEVVQRTCDYAKPVVTVKLNSSGKPVLSWDAVKGATKYEVYRATSENGTYTKIWGSSATTCTHTGAVSGTTYYYKVRALGSNTNANSAYSAVVSIKCK